MESITQRYHAYHDDDSDIAYPSRAGVAYTITSQTDIDSSDNTLSSADHNPLEYYMDGLGNMYLHGVTPYNPEFLPPYSAQIFTYGCEGSNAPAAYTSNYPGEADLQGYDPQVSFESNNTQDYDVLYDATGQYAVPYALLAKSTLSPAHGVTTSNKHESDDPALQLEQSDSSKLEEEDGLRLEEVFNLDGLVLTPQTSSGLGYFEQAILDRPCSTQLFIESDTPPLQEATWEKQEDSPISDGNVFPIFYPLDSLDNTSTLSGVNGATDVVDNFPKAIAHISEKSYSTLALGGVVYSPKSMEPLEGTLVTAPPTAPHKQRRVSKRLTHVACLFCRRRKIACGGPMQSGDNKSQCFQCARRSQPCEYPATQHGH